MGEKWWWNILTVPVNKYAAATREIPVGRKNCAGDAGISFEANEIAQVPVVELIEIRRGPALIVCGTGEGCGRDDFPRQRAKKLI